MKDKPREISNANRRLPPSKAKIKKTKGKEHIKRNLVTQSEGKVQSSPRDIIVHKPRMRHHAV
jgi:hypothetical protein